MKTQPFQRGESVLPQNNRKCYSSYLDHYLICPESLILFFSIETSKNVDLDTLNTERAYKRSAVCTLSKTRVRHLHGVNNSKTIDMLTQVKQRK